MAEERLIDDDKDRKYKIRVNEDGEEELIIVGDEEEEPEEELAEEFIVPEVDEDDEEAAVMTPEQLAAREKARQEENERRARFVGEQKRLADDAFAEEDFDGAAYYLSRALEEDGENGELCALKFRALSRNLTDFTRLDECVEAAEAVGDYCSVEQRKALLDDCGSLSDQIARTRDEVDRLSAENEQKRAERRTVFVRRRKSAAKFFLCTALPFVLFLALAIGFSTVMFADQRGTYLIITVAFAVLAAIAFIATLITGHKLWAAQRNIALNAKNSSTKLGRKLEETQKRLKSLSDIYAAIDGRS